MVNFILIHEKTLNSNQVFNTKINFLCKRRVKWTSTHKDALCLNFGDQTHVRASTNSTDSTAGVQSLPPAF